MKPRRSRASSQNLALLDPPKTVAVAVGVVVPVLPPGPTRDFGAARELVWNHDRDGVVVREKQAPRDGGAHTYTAYVVGEAAKYSVTAELSPDADIALRTFGRVDTLRPPCPFDPITEYSAEVDWRLAQQRNALDMIRELCPETIHVRGDAVFDGPGYVTMLARPETRYAAVLAAVVPT